jgi:hypothetical protein
MPSEGSADTLVIANNDELVDTRLVAAIKSASASTYVTEASLSGIVGWLASAGPCN